MNVGVIMGVFYGYSFWMDRVLAMNMGIVGVMGVFYGYSFWMDRIVAMNVGIMGVFYGLLFWMDREFWAMNVEYVLCAMDVLCGLFWM
jgi:hypothetical protein